MSLRIPFFPVGTHTDSRGRTVEITSEELDRRISLYNDQQAHEAPLVLGHPATNDPAYGWIERLGRDGDTMYADVRDEQPELREWLGKKLFKKVSGSFYASGLLRHVGLLGATPPAIKGLPAVQFAEGEEETFEFADNLYQLKWVLSSVQTALRGIRDWLIEEKGLEVADRVVSTWLVDSIEYTPPEPANTEAAFADPAGAPAGGDPAGGDPAGTESEEVQQLRRQLAESEARYAERERRSQVEAFCDSEEMRCRITPAMRPVVVEMLLATEGTEFAEPGTETGTAEGGAATVTLAEKFREMLRALPSLVEFRETVTGGAGADEPDSDVERARRTAERFKERS